MALSITATPVDSTGIVSIDFSFGGAVYDTYQIIRTNIDDGTQTALRGSSYQTVPSGGIDIITADAECPLTNSDGVGPTCYYTGYAYMTNDDGSIASTDSIDSDSFQLLDDDKVAWFKNPGLGDVDKRFLLDHIDPMAYQARVLTNTPVLGRANPIIVTDVLGGRAGTFYITSIPEAESIYGYEYSRAAIMSLFAPGTILFFQTTPETTGINDMFFMVTGDITESPYEGPIGPDRMWTIPFTEVDSPEGGLTLSPTVTWLDVGLNHPSWQDIETNVATWLALLEDG